MIAPDVSCAAEKATFKNYPRNIFHDKNHFITIILVHITWNTALKLENTYWWRNVEFNKIATTWNFVSLHSLTRSLIHSLPDHSCKAAVNGDHFTPQQQTYLWDVPFKVPTSVGPLDAITRVGRYWYWMNFIAILHAKIKAPSHSLNVSMSACFHWEVAYKQLLCWQINQLTWLVLVHMNCTK